MRTATTEAGAMTDCGCPRFATRRPTRPFLVSHTLACLRAQRGGATLAEHYGEPARVVLIGGIDIPVGFYTALAKSGEVAQSTPLRAGFFEPDPSDEERFDALLTDPFTGDLA